MLILNVNIKHQNIDNANVDFIFICDFDVI